MMIKIFLVVFFLFALSRAVLRFRDGHISARALGLLCVFWIGASVIVLVPDVTTLLARALGVGRGADAVIYLTVAGLCYFIFRIYIRIREVEQQLTVLVRKLALRDAEKTNAPAPPRPGAEPAAK